MTLLSKMIHVNYQNCNRSPAVVHFTHLGLQSFNLVISHAAFLLVFYLCNHFFFLMHLVRTLLHVFAKHAQCVTSMLEMLTITISMYHALSRIHHSQQYFFQVCSNFYLWCTFFICFSFIFNLSLALFIHLAILFAVQTSQSLLISEKFRNSKIQACTGTKRIKAQQQHPKVRSQDQYHLE